MKLRFASAIAFAACGWGQPAGQLAFEVASVKVAPPPEPGKGMFMGMNGGPGSKDPGMYRCTNCNLLMLVYQAYDTKGYLVTRPDWMNTGDRYEVSAKVPEGATKEQFRLMLQNLLAERFKLTVHREKKEMAVFDLVVAKGGHKLKEWVPDPPKDGGDDVISIGGGRGGGGRGGPNVDKEGYPIMQKGCKGCIMVMNGKARMSADGATMKEFADTLANQVSKPVIDATGLNSKYFISVTYDMNAGRGGLGPQTIGPPSSSDRPLDADSDTGVPIVSAIQTQLGLKLESKKGQVEMLVIDHAEKVPTEN